MRGETAIRAKWWTEDETDAHEATFATLRAIENNQTFRRAQNLRFARLYGNYEMVGLSAWQYSRPASLDRGGQKLQLNVIKSCVDTATAKIAKAKPKPEFLTEQGNWSMQRKAKQRTKYVEGLFDRGKIYQVGQRCFVDAGVFGTGAMRIFEEKGVVRYERTFVDELFVDDAEGMYGTPRTLYQRRHVSRDVLLAMFPDKAGELSDAGSDLKADAGQFVSDLVTVVEAWHLPSSEYVDGEKTDGRHIICADNVTLFVEEYTKDYFPFVFLRWTPRLLGFWGSGLAEELQGIQLEINKLLRSIQQAQHLMAVPRIFVERNSQVNVSHLNNDFASVIHHTGPVPTALTWPAMSPEVYQHLENLYRKAYEITGVSQLSAQSSKPKGLDSGVALREFQDIESERFSLIGQAWEEFFIDAARISLDLVAHAYKEDREVVVKAIGPKYVEDIKFSEINDADERFVMRAWPVSMLPSSPAGRLQSVTDLVQAGFIEQDQAIALLGFPDVSEFTSLATAALDDIRRILAGFSEGKAYEPPEPAMNLTLSMKETLSAYLRARADNAPEDVLEKMRRFMEDIMTIQAPPPAPAAPAMGPPGAPPMDPMGQPPPPPTSDLLPVGGAPMAA